MCICTKLKIFYVQHSSNQLCGRFFATFARLLDAISVVLPKTSTHSRIPPHTPHPTASLADVHPFGGPPGAAAQSAAGGKPAAAHQSTVRTPLHLSLHSKIP
jgi:hypothetical protein